jgi:predicted SAM-dependent methyltransferase
MRRFSKAKPHPAKAGSRLHIGCGEKVIPKWINIDSRKLPGVDYILDVREGIPFEGAAAIYAEHFLEHLSLDEGLAFLKECRRALAPDGNLRISTPNLDWVLASHYRLGQPIPDEERVVDCFRLLRAFHGWGHRFLYNRSMLSASLRASGFETVRFQRYGESGEPSLRGLERHETWEDTPELPHVLIAEASGIAWPQPLPEKPVREFLAAVETT